MAILGRLVGRAIKKGAGRKARTAAQKSALKKAVIASAKARAKKGGSLRSKYYAKRLVKVKKKLAKNSSEIKAARTGKDTILRLQNSKGQGPLMKRVIPPMGISNLTGKPLPVNPRQKLGPLRKAMPDFEFEHLKFDGSSKFGFKNIAQAKRFFVEKEREWYKKRGYELARVSNVKITAQTPNQLVFLQAKNATKLANKNKQLKSLLKKYGG